MSSEIKAPYNFVPLSNWIFSPSWAEQVSQDIPFEDGVSGSMEVSLTTHQPLMIAGEVTPANDAEKTPQIVNYLRDPIEKKPIIPGSSLKGMIRHVLQIGSFGKMNLINDTRFGVRDLAAKGPGSHIRDPNVNFYLHQMGRANSGFLRFQNNEWVIVPCRWARIKQRAYTQWAGVSEKSWFDKNNMSPMKRYQLLDKGNNIKSQAGTYPKKLHVNIAEDPDSYPIKGKKGLRANIDKNGELAYLVVSGQPSTNGAWNFDKLEEKKGSGKAKNNDFVFFDLQEESLPVNDRVIQDFLFIHSNKNPQNKEPIWDFWKNRVSQGMGVPVFWKNDDDGAVKSIGLSSMYRLAYDYSVADVVGHSSSGHKNNDISDLADTLFGRIDDDAGNARSLRGRVNFTAARAQNYQAAKALTTVLSSPKATYYPNYLVQSSSRHEYSTMFEDDSIIRGWKRYPIRSKITPIPINPDMSYKVKSTLKPVAPNAEFSFHIHFHNLKLFELGALLWAISWGNNSDARHSLGMGKSLGYGSCQLKVKKLDCLANSGEQVSSEAELIALYQNTLDVAIKQSNGNKNSPTLVETAQYQALLAMALPDEVPVGHMVMEDKNNEFSKAKKVKNNALRDVLSSNIKVNWLDTPKITNESGEQVAAAIAMGGAASEENLQRQEKAMAQEKELAEMPAGIKFMQEKVSWVLGQKANSAQPGDANFGEILGYLTEPPEVINNDQDMKYLAHVCYLLCKDKAGGKWSSKKHEKTIGRARKQKANELMAGEIIPEEAIKEYYKL